MRYSNIDKIELKKSNVISRKYNTVWKRFAGRSSIGDCSNLFQRLNPTSYYDFYVKYTKDGEETVGNREDFLYYGRTEGEIEELAKKYMEACGDYSFSLSQYIDNIYMHTIIETFDGQMKERSVGEILLNKGFTYEKPKKDEDACMGIDFKVYKDGKFIFALQIKPISFFKGFNNKSLIEDRKNSFHKERMVKEVFNVPTYYMVYKSDDSDGSVTWLSHNDINNSNLCFHLSELCSGDTGYPYDLSKYKFIRYE